MEFNLVDIFESLADTVPDNVAVVCGEDRLTYGQLDKRANRLAHFLASKGVGAGDHIGLYLFNSAEYIEAMIAALKIRAVPINVNYRYVADELRYLFDDADMVALVHQREFGSVAQTAAAGLDKLKLFVAVDAGSEAELAANTIGYEEAMAQGAESRDFEPRSADDLYIIYTGGTTGMPKGVMWRQEDLFFAGLQGGNPGDDDVDRPEQVAEIVAADREKLNIHPAAPLIHGSSQLASWISFWTGGLIGLVPGRSFVPTESARLCQDEGLNVINLVGDAMSRPFAEVVETGNYDLEQLYCVTSAGAILSDAVKAQLEKVFPDAMIMNNYGASETGHQGTAIDMGTKRPRFFMHDNTAVLDEEMNPVGVGEVGKLARKGHIPLGYYKDEVKTASTFKVAPDGVRWVIPGDFARVEDDGTVTLLGRGSICINTGGEKVYPEEVEEVFKSHPAVMDAVVVGVDDERWGQRVTGLVQLREGTEPSLDELAAHCREKVAGYKTPREIHIVQTIDRHPSGKPDYRWAKRIAEERTKL